MPEISELVKHAQEEDIFQAASEKEWCQRKIEGVELCRKDFIQVVQIAHGPRMTDSDIQLMTFMKPHLLPKKLAPGTMFVFVFLWDRFFLKIVPGGTLRDLRRQYTFGRGTVAGAVLRSMPRLGKRRIPGWLRANTDLFVFTMPARLGKDTHGLLKNFLTLRLAPHH